MKQFLLGYLTLLMLCVNLYGQSFQIQQSVEKVPRLELRFLHPSFADTKDQAIHSGIYDLSFSYPISDRWSLVTSVPYVVANYIVDINLPPDYDDPLFIYDYPISDKGFGNIGVGAVTKWSFESGELQWYNTIYLPTSGSNRFDSFLLKRGELLNLQKYVANGTSVTSEVVFGKYSSKGLIYSISGGPQFIIHSEEIKRELFYKYSLGAGYNFGAVAFVGEWIGRYHDNKDFYKSEHHYWNTFNGSMHFTRGKFRPAILYSYVFEDRLRDWFSVGSVGFKLTYLFL